VDWGGGRERDGGRRRPVSGRRHANVRVLMKLLFFKRKKIREASRQFAYFNEITIFFIEHLYHTLCLFFPIRPLLFCCSRVNVYIVFLRWRTLGSTREGSTAELYYVIDH